MAYRVFIDGKEGTTGLRITERLSGRNDIQLLEIDEALRKSTVERKRLINESDYTILCLPDEAAIESVSLCDNKKTKIIYASTAHRTNTSWAYGFPELSPEHRSAIKTQEEFLFLDVTQAGLMLCLPSCKNKLIPPYQPIVCHAVSGYSGAGKSIAQYESPDRPEELDTKTLFFR